VPISSPLTHQIRLLKTGFYTNMAVRGATLVDKLALLPLALTGISVGILRLVARPFTHDAKPPTAFKDFFYTVLRYVLASLTVPQEKWMLPTTDKAYLAWARGKGLQPDTAVLESGLKIHWIGKSSAQKVFLYFHGGGYVRPMSMEHLDWLLELQTELSKTKSIAIAAVSYTCAPEGQYPLQLRQGVESLLWLLKTLGRKPEDVSDAVPSMSYDIMTDTLYADIRRWRLGRWQLDLGSFVSLVASSS
jgi:hypothetical protein